MRNGLPTKREQEHHDRLTKIMCMYDKLIEVPFSSIIDENTLNEIKEMPKLNGNGKTRPKPPPGFKKKPVKPKNKKR